MISTKTNPTENLINNYIIAPVQKPVLIARWKKVNEKLTCQWISQ